MEGRALDVEHMVVYENTAGSYSKETELEEFRRQADSACYVRSESWNNRTTERWCSFCELTPPAAGFVIPSCLDLLIGSPQAASVDRLFHLDILSQLTTLYCASV